METLQDAKEILKRYKTLPPAVKTLFFAKDSDSVFPEPFSMVKDLLKFTDEDTWKNLCELALQDEKSSFINYLNSFVERFIQSEKENFQLKLGTTATKKNSEGKILKASNKAQAIAQFCEPRKWIAKDVSN